MKAVLLVSHGSKSPKARQEIDALAARLAAQLTEIFESAFLEIEKPSIPEGLESCAKRGATEITLLLNFLNSGRHVLEDIPRLVREFESTRPGVVCRITPCLGSQEGPEGIDRLYLNLVKRTSC